MDPPSRSPRGILLRMASQVSAKGDHTAFDGYVEVACADEWVGDQSGEDSAAEFGVRRTNQHGC